MYRREKAQAKAAESIGTLLSYVKKIIHNKEKTVNKLPAMMEDLGYDV